MLQIINSYSNLPWQNFLTYRNKNTSPDKYHHCVNYQGNGSRNVRIAGSPARNPALHPGIPLPVNTGSHIPVYYWPPVSAALTEALPSNRYNYNHPAV